MVDNVMATPVMGEYPAFQTGIERSRNPFAQGSNALNLRVATARSTREAAIASQTRNDAQCVTTLRFNFFDIECLQCNYVFRLGRG